MVKWMLRLSTRTRSTELMAALELEQIVVRHQMAKCKYLAALRKNEALKELIEDDELQAIQDKGKNKSSLLSQMKEMAKKYRAQTKTKC